MSDTVSSAMQAFRAEIAPIVALFHDARLGFRWGTRNIEAGQQRMMAAMPDDPTCNNLESLDEKTVHYGNGEPWADGSTVRFTSKARDYKSRNAPEGANDVLVGNLCVVALYQLWEDEHRGAIAKAMGVAKDTLVAPVFGDIRRLRRSVIHNRAKSFDRIDQYELFQWFDKGASIEIGDGQFDEIVNAVYAYLDSLV